TEIRRGCFQGPLEGAPTLRVDSLEFKPHPRPSPRQVTPAARRNLPNVTGGLPGPGTGDASPSWMRVSVDTSRRFSSCLPLSRALRTPFEHRRPRAIAIGSRNVTGARHDLVTEPKRLRVDRPVCLGPFRAVGVSVARDHDRGELRGESDGLAIDAGGE